MIDDEEVAKHEDLTVRLVGLLDEAEPELHEPLVSARVAVAVADLLGFLLAVPLARFGEDAFQTMLAAAMRRAEKTARTTAALVADAERSTTTTVQ